MKIETRRSDTLAGDVTPLNSAEIRKLAQDIARRSEAKLGDKSYGLGSQLIGYDRALRALAARATNDAQPEPAAAWVIDNYPLLHTLVREIKTSLPKEFYRSLPRLTDAEFQGRARVDYAICELVDLHHGAVSAEALEEFVSAFEEIRPLSLAELWSAKHLLHFHLIRVVATEASKGTGQHREQPEVGPISAAVTSLRKLEAFNWKDFVEGSLAVEAELRKDPSGDYPHADFPTRDLYRHAVEGAARRSIRAGEDVADAEIRIARTAIELAQTRADKERERRGHVGYWLLDKGLPELRKACDYRPRAIGSFRDFVRRYPSVHYLTATFVVTAAILSGAYAILSPVPAWTLLFLVLPAIHVALAILNPLVTFLLPPRRLARLDFSDGVPPQYKTVVVVPTLLLSPKNVKELLENIEIHYLANRDPNTLFALLTDFPDADAEHTSKDGLLDMCIEGIEDLNERYASSGQQPFYLFHRPRKWNAAEGKWMGQERKRGKLNHFNEWLLGKSDEFSAKIGDLERLRGARYVITLDSDTQLPRDTARKMIGMIAHPLNRATLDPKTNIVVDGYALLLPRVGVSIQSSAKSRLARLYSGKVGYDPYATAVSDVYMDLFGQASFTGKGIYEVEVFERAASHFPDNTLLSHDLIEGEHVRVGLCADQEVIDDFPQRYEAFSKRKHRWVRGDWQIIRWLGPSVPDKLSRTARNPLPLISRWKIFDNLRRSLMEISLLLLFAGAWTFLPGPPLLWTLVGLALFVLPVWFDLIVAAIRIPPPRFIRAYVREVSFRFVQGHLDALITLIFLPHQALLMADAILRTWTRQFITHKHLLEWESMAAAEASASSGGRPSLSTIYLWAASVLALVLMLLVPGGEDWSNLAFLLLEMWLVAPLVSLWLDSAPARPRSITAEDREFLRDIALNTWRYYVDLVNEDNRWLVPDNVQEVPPAIANRTSPTNIGLQLNAYQAALDFGYLTAEEFAALTSRTLESMGRLARVRGHWLNWYDTRSGEILYPAYLSSVDSGNLAASLLVLKQGCLERIKTRLHEPSDRQGLVDLVRRVGGTLPREHREHPANRILQSMVTQLGTEPTDLFFWEGLLTETQKAAERLHLALESDARTETRYWIEQLQKRLSQQFEQLCAFAPWLGPPVEEELRFSFSDPAMSELLTLLSTNPRWSELPDHYDRVTAAVRERLNARRSVHELTRQALRHLLEAVPKARRRAIEVVASLNASATTAAAWVDDMDFSFVFDAKRNLLRIGCNVGGDPQSGMQPEKLEPDDSYYDLLASEARTAVFLGIAKGEMPREAWFQLGRKLTHWRGNHCLVSWSGTMFEYLMPNLFMRSYEGTLLHATLGAVLKIQRAYGREHKVVWGVSESAYNSRDSLQNYQYHAFGIPSICARRDLSGRTVTAPYATMLALLADPVAAVENARGMKQRGWMGTHGFFEAVDYTSAQGHGTADEPAVVHAFMAHHQGMTLLAISSAVLHNPMQNRFHADPMVQAAEYLLQERAPEMLPEPDELPPQQPKPLHQRESIGTATPDGQDAGVRTQSESSEESPSVPDAAKRAAAGDEGTPPRLQNV